MVTVATAQRDKTAAQKHNDRAVSLPLFFFLIYCEAFWNNPLNVFKPIKWNTASTLCEVYKHERQRHQRTWHASHNKSRCTLHFSCPPWFRASCTGKWHFSVMYLPSNDAIKFMQVDILTWITVVLPADGMLSGSRVICCYDGVYSLATVFFFFTLRRNIFDEGQALHTCHFSDFMPQK